MALAKQQQMQTVMSNLRSNLTLTLLYIGNCKTEVKKQGNSRNSKNSIAADGTIWKYVQFLLQIMTRHPTKHRVDSKK